MICVPAAAETEMSREATEAPDLEQTQPAEFAGPVSEEATAVVEAPVVLQAELPSMAIAASAYFDAFEEDDTVAQARAITLGAPQSHTIHVLGDVDWVKFDVVAGGRYQIDTLPGALGFDTEIYLYASDGVTVLGSDDDSGIGDTFAALYFEPSTTETVYLQISAKDNLTTGAYRLSVTGGSLGPDAYEADDELASASTIVIDGAAQKRTLHAATDNDWVRVELVADTAYTFQTHPGDSDLDTYLHLFDSVGVELLTDDDSGADYYSMINYTPSISGTYYLKVRPYSSSEIGEYLLTASTTPPIIQGDAFEPDNDAASAKPITTDGVHQAHTLHVADDLDYVSFQAQDGVTYQIQTHEVSVGIDTEMYLYDADGVTELGYDDDGAGIAYTSYIEYTANETGTLYVLVHPYDLDETGAYSLTVLALTPDKYEVDDMSTDAKQIAPGIAQTRTLHRDFDEDWARLDVIAGLKYTIDTRPGTASMDTALYLYDADLSTELDSDDDSGSRYYSHLEYEAVENTTLYISVVGATKGQYILAVECNDVTPPVTTTDAVSSYNVSASIALAASDPTPGVGVAATYYILDGAAKQVYSGPIAVGSVGTHTLQFWSVDKVTNAETVKSVTFQVIAPPTNPTTTSGTRSAGTTTVSNEATAVAASVMTTPAIAPGDEPEAGEESGEVELTTTSAGDDLGDESGDGGQAPFFGWVLGGLLILLMLGGVAAFARKK